MSLPTVPGNLLSEQPVSALGSHIVGASADVVTATVLAMRADSGASRRHE
jgi:hypothetical protein